MLVAVGFGSLVFFGPLLSLPFPAWSALLSLPVLLALSDLSAFLLALSGLEDFSALFGFSFEPASPLALSVGVFLALLVSSAYA